MGRAADRLLEQPRSFSTYRAPSANHRVAGRTNSRTPTIRSHVHEPDPVAQAALAQRDVERALEDRPVHDEAVVLADLAGEVGASLGDLVQHGLVDHPTEQRCRKHLITHRHYYRFEARLEQLLHDAGTIALPQRKASGRAALPAHPLDPLAMALDVDVAEDARGRALLPGPATSSEKPRS